MFLKKQWFSLSWFQPYLHFAVYFQNCRDLLGLMQLCIWLDSANAAVLLCNNVLKSSLCDLLGQLCN